MAHLGDYANLALRKGIFSGCKLHVGMTAGLQHEFWAQNFQLNSLKNGPFGNHANIALILISGVASFGVANLISRKAYFSGYAHKNELVIGNIDIFAGYYFFAREKILSEIKTFCSIAGQQAQCLISMAFVGFIKSRGVRWPHWFFT
jgi:hypothetical protein